MIGIIGAMEEEVIILKELMDIYDTKKVGLTEFIVGSLHGRGIVLAKSGIGKVNAARTATLLMEKFQIEAVINTGSAGGLKSEAKIGDVVISDGVSYHDVDVTGFGYERGQVPGLPTVFSSDTGLMKKVDAVLTEARIDHFVGHILTGDVFIYRPDQLTLVKEAFPNAVALEMEAAAIAQVCYLEKIPFLVVRALSDIAGKASDISFEEFLPKAALASSKMIEALIKRM